MIPVTKPLPPSAQEPLRFELTAEQTARYTAWAAAIQRAYHEEELLGPAEITISFRLTGVFGTEIVASSGGSKLFLQEL